MAGAETFNVCLSMCSNTPGCYFWSWTTDLHCTLFWEDVEEVVAENVVSGASTCPNLARHDKVRRQLMISLYSVFRCLRTWWSPCSRESTERRGSYLRKRRQRNKTMKVGMT